MSKLRIGFLSTAGIGRKNWKAIQHSGKCVVSAVASRDLARSRAYIADGQRAFPFPKEPLALGSYEELLASPEVDAIYVPVPTLLRHKLVIQAAKAGKHVICEKPCAANVAELKAMQAACRKYWVQFMDGVMFMHNPRMARLRKVLDDGKSVGPVRRIASAFTFFPNEKFFRTNIRADGGLEPAGSLGDLGWYCIRFALWTLNWELPETVVGRILTESETLPGRKSAPTEFAATLLYRDGVTVDFYASFRAANEQWVMVGGQNGWLRVPDFVHSFNTYESAFEVNGKFVTVPGKTKCPAGADPAEMGHATAQDTQMWRNFADQVASGQLNEEWPMWSLKTQLVLDACMESARKRAAVKVRG